MTVQFYCGSKTTWEGVTIPCQLTPGHGGSHEHKIEWTDPPPKGGGEEAGVREPRRPKPGAGALAVELSER